MARRKLDFIQQQGFATFDETPDTFYSALTFQPRVVGLVVAAGVLLQGAWVFFVLSAVLGWSALVPTHNPFDAVYNRMIARPRHLRPLEAAPAPRRFAQGLAAGLALSIALALGLESTITAWAIEALFAAAIAAVLFGRFCGGSYIYGLLRSWSMVHGSLTTHSKG